MANPYLELYDMMRNATPIKTTFKLGTVKSRLPNLEISLDDIVLYKDDFLIGSSLITLNNANITSDDTNIEHNLKDSLNVGDKVLLTRVEGTFILLSKVVSL
ncbi:DUF2577 family protein [Paraclostridium ghonii]|uniref:DUF2577 family protein n=1 Tax=Paraclostridium ghonii TaxID=29358 RepID=UPI00352479AD